MVTSFMRIRIPHIDSTVDPIPVKINLPLQQYSTLSNLNLRLHLMSDNTDVNMDYQYEVFLNIQHNKRVLKQAPSRKYGADVEALKERLPGISHVDDLEGKLELYELRKKKNFDSEISLSRRMNSKVLKSNEISEDIRLDSEGSSVSDLMDPKPSCSEVDASNGTGTVGNEKSKEVSKREQELRPNIACFFPVSHTTTWARKYRFLMASKDSKTKLERLVPDTLSGSQWMRTGSKFDFAIEDDYMSELHL